MALSFSKSDMIKGILASLLSVTDPSSSHKEFPMGSTSISCCVSFSPCFD